MFSFPSTFYELTICKSTSKYILQDKFNYQKSDTNSHKIIFYRTNDYQYFG